MKDVEETLRTILRAAIELAHPTTEAIADATGICSDCVEKYLVIAEALGFAERSSN